MALIYDQDFRTGSQLDKVTNTLPTKNSVPYFETSKMMALRFDGTDDSFGGTDLSDNAYAFSIYFRSDIVIDKDQTAEAVPLYLEDDGGTYVFNGIILGQFTTAVDDEIISLAYMAGHRTCWADATASLAAHTWHHALFNWNGSSYDIWVDGDKKTTTSGTSSHVELYTASDVWVGSDIRELYNFGGLIGRAQIWNASLSTQEVLKDYEEFLHSYNISPPKTNFVYPKATDLSNVSNLVAAYNMIPQDGELIDISGNHETGTITGAVSTLEGMSFDGVDDYINIDTALTDLASTTKGTWSAWVKPTDATPGDAISIIGFGDTNVNTSLYFRNLSNRKLSIIATRGGVNKFILTTDNSVFTDKILVHVVIVQDGTEPILYVDGVAVDQTFIIDVDRTIWFNDVSLIDNGRIGCLNVANNGNILFYDGTIDDVRLYDTNLSQAQVEALYNERARQKLVVERFEGIGADNVASTHLGEWTVDSGTFSVHEDATSKYINCTGNGTISMVVELNEYTGNGYIESLDGDLSGDAGDTVSNASNVAYSGNRLTLTMTSGQKVRNLVIQKGVTV